MQDIETIFPNPSSCHGTKITLKWKEKSGGEAKSNKQKVDWMTSNKKLFLDSTLEKKVKGNRSGKAINATGWKNIFKSFNEKTDLEYEFLQFKNLYGQLRSSCKHGRVCLKTRVYDTT